MLQSYFTNMPNCNSLHTGLMRKIPRFRVQPTRSPVQIAYSAQMTERDRPTWPWKITPQGRPQN